jgi:hypothetical protein
MKNLPQFLKDNEEYYNNIKSYIDKKTAGEIV